MPSNLIAQGRLKGLTMAGGSGFLLFGHRKYSPIIPEFKHPYSKCACVMGKGRVIDSPIEAVKKAGIEKLWINLHTAAATIRDYSGIEAHRRQGLEISWIEEDRLYGTAGSLKNFAEASGLKPDDLVVIQNGDVVHNYDLLPIIEAHMKQVRADGKPGLTAIVNPISDWNMMKLYGSVKLAGMKDRGEFKTWKAFEEYIGQWYESMLGSGQRMFEVIDYAEKMPRTRCLSNLNDASIYVINGSLILEMLPLLTRMPLMGEKEVEGKYFYDFSKHVTRWILENHDKYSFYARVMPDEDGGKKNYWLDIGTRRKLWQANMDILDGKIDVGLEAAEGTNWNRRTWGWEGNDVAIDPSSKDGIKDSIIGDSVRIGKHVTLQHCVIGSGVVVEDGVRLVDTVVFPSYSNDEPTVVGHHSHIEKMIIMGGMLDPDSVKKGKGGEILFVPNSGMVELPAEEDVVYSIDEKREHVLEKVKDSGFAYMCLGGMPMKHLETVGIDRLLNQIGHISTLFDGYKKEVEFQANFNVGPQYLVYATNRDIPDASEIMIAAKDEAKLLGYWGSRIGKSITINDAPFPLRIRTDWSIMRDGVTVLIFEVTDDKGDKLSDKVLKQVLEQLGGGKPKNMKNRRGRRS
ncbi:sugar phosphate nucleotidyltransferase [Candidatus Margulisiibacteriota bacterium]